MKGFIWCFRVFEGVVWLSMLLIAGKLAYDGHYWIAGIVLAVFYFGLPLIFIQIRRRLGLVPFFPDDEFRRPD
jgi:hypothetical protein